jgi:hypothetical protein
MGVDTPEHTKKKAVEVLHRATASFCQSRSNSLIPVFERVWASTVLTITAQ